MLKSYSFMDSDLVFLALGANLGDKYSSIELAINAIATLQVSIIKKSSVYLTEPWGYVEQDYFLNQIIAVETKIKPGLLLHQLHEIEDNMGRKRTIKNAPRIIDIDIIFYKDLIIDEEGLHIPHPRMHLRNFILMPIVEIADQFVHPILKKSMMKLLHECEDNSSVKKLKIDEIIS